PLRCNQLNPTEFSKLKRRKRKRIETLFSQLDGQFSMNVNFAKIFYGLAARTIPKITDLTMSQYLNLFVFNRPLNIIKCNIS
ncbi:MAG: IS982 family transposase, partial [Prevotellaceae bacterium]|nr:IS982 family transposase [Prevotellaceae bacterium]